MPLASRSVAVAWDVPIAVMLFGVSVTATVATGATLTVIDEVAVLPSLLAVIVAGPALTAVTSPFASTVAMPGALDDHVTVRPVNVLPFASFVTAANCCVGVMPSTSDAEEGLTVTVATGAFVTVKIALPVLPSLDATMFAVPGVTAAITP